MARAAKSPTMVAVDPSEHPVRLLAAVRNAAHTVLEPTGWTDIDWDFPDADADLEIYEDETAEIKRIVTDLATLASDEADLVVEIAKSQARLLGGTENYVVTREFRDISTREQRVKLLECIYAVAAADGTISNMESAELANIAEELGFTRPEANAIRSRYKDKLAEFQG